MTKYSALAVARQWLAMLGIILIASHLVLSSAHADIISQQVAVSDSADDAEQRGDYFSIDSSDLELTNPPSQQRIGIRFNGIGIEQGSKVMSAYIQFQVDEATTGLSQIRITAEAADDALTFSSSNDVLSREDTLASVLWSPTDWPSVGEAGVEQRTADVLSTISSLR